MLIRENPTPFHSISFNWTGRNQIWIRNLWDIFSKVYFLFATVIYDNMSMLRKILYHKDNLIAMGVEEVDITESYW